MTSQLQTAQCLTNKWLWNEYFAHETMRNSLIPKNGGGRGCGESERSDELGCSVFNYHRTIALP